MDLQNRVASALADRYRILGEIGRGGMATVFLAEDAKHQRRVAIKVLDQELSQTLGPERFLREIQTAARLTHPHILPLHDSGEADGLLYYVMPYVKGESLRARLSREKQLPVGAAINLAREIASALAYAHAEGLVHRDVKPANILLESGQAVLADFGLAQAISDSDEKATRLTRTGVSVGTPTYMSPEQAAGEENLDGRSDQYALGCILFEMLAGEPAFAGSTPQAILAKKLGSAPPSLSLFRSTIPTGIEQVVRRTLERAPADRFSSMEEFSEALESAARGAPESSQPGHRKNRGHRRWALPVAGGIVVAMILSLGPFLDWFQGKHPSWGEGHPRSFAVLPFHVPSSSELERSAARNLADALARELDWWSSVRAFGPTALAGIIHDLGVSGPTFQSSDAGIRVARRGNAEALLAVNVRIEDDSALIQGTLYDARTGHLAGEPISVHGDATAPAEKAVPISLDLLGIDGPAPIPRSHGTTRLAAFRAFLLGQNRFLEGEYREAQARFADAIQEDTDYASALSWLALSLYWDAVEGSGRLSGLRSDIARYSTVAQDRLSTLEGPDSLHVAAFFAFQRGDYGESRRLFGRLVELNPEDIVSWLMLGEVELNDLWLVPRPSGGMMPRANLNTALEAFRTTTTIRPSFELGYARSFRVAEDLDRVRRVRACPLFSPLRPDPIPPGSGPGVENATAYCPVVGDSIRWVPKSELDAADLDAVSRGADRIFDRTVQMLQAWEDFAPSAPRPKEFLAEVLVSRRQTRAIAPPQRAKQEATRALEYAKAAWALENDTTQEELFYLANLELAGGSAVRALELARKGLARHRSMPDSSRRNLSVDAANVFLATGQLATALEVVRQHSGTRLVQDPVFGGLIGYAGAEPVAFVLAVLGAGGVTGDPVRRELARLDSIWDAAGYSEHQRKVLRNAMTLRIGTALVQDPEAYRIWERKADPDSHMWEALGLEPGCGDSSRCFEEALNRATGRTDEAIRTFLIAWKAQRSGQDALAHRLFSRLDSIPSKITAFDSNWGLTANSLLRRAEISHEGGDLSAAEMAIQRFLSLWPEADSMGQILVRRARIRLQRIQDEGGP